MSDQRQRGPSISIVLCTRDRAESLAPTLASIGRTTVPRDWNVELIIVDNGSTDHTGQVVHAFSETSTMRVRYLVEHRRGKSNALNAGVKASSADIILFTDDDVRCPPLWIEDMCQPILAGDASAVQGGIRWAPELLAMCGQQQYLPRVITSTRHKSETELSYALIGANMAISRVVLCSIGEFDPELGPGALGLGEETMVAWQMLERGYVITRALDTEIEHYFDPKRLTRKGLLELARSKGRSLAYLQYHWQQKAVRMLFLRKIVLHTKNIVRTILSPRHWPSGQLIPEWRYSYEVQISRLEQLTIESKRPRKYKRADPLPINSS